MSADPPESSDLDVSNASLLTSDADTTSTDLETTSDEERALTTTVVAVDTVSDVINYHSLVPLCFLQFCESWNSDSIFAYVSFLVVDFDPDLTRDEAGLYAGLVAGGCFFGNFLSSYFWGYLSDRYGRKRLLISGTVGTLVSVILVGFSSSIWWAIAARSFSGIMNGNLGIAKSLIGEISTSKTLAQSFGLLGIAWGLGTICGSIAGGLLAQPAKKMPSLFGQTLFETFPYLLPNVVSAAMLLLGLIATIVFLKEPERAQKSTNPGVGSESVLKLIWREKQIMLTIAMYVCCGAINTFCKETNPLFFVASLDHGGLNFGTGIMIGLTGASTILFQLFVYKRLSAFLGLVRSFRFGLACFSLLTALVPLSHFVLKVSSVFMWMYTGTLFVASTCASQMLFSSVFALISNSTEKEAMGRVNGVSQSLVALFRAIGPPIAGNLFAWSIRDLGRSFPFNFFFNYLVQILLFGGVFALSILLSPALNKPKNEQSIQMEIIKGNQTDSEELKTDGGE